MGEVRNAGGVGALQESLEHARELDLSLLRDPVIPDDVDRRKRRHESKLVCLLALERSVCNLDHILLFDFGTGDVHHDAYNFTLLSGYPKYLQDAERFARSNVIYDGPLLDPPDQELSFLDGQGYFLLTSVLK